MAIALDWIRGQTPEIIVNEETRGMWKVKTLQPCHVFGYGRSEGEARLIRAVVTDLLERISEAVEESGEIARRGEMERSAVTCRSVTSASIPRSSPA